jgi:hypothetical protein
MRLLMHPARSTSPRGIQTRLPEDDSEWEDFAEEGFAAKVWKLLSSNKGGSLGHTTFDAFRTVCLAERKPLIANGRELCGQGG